MFNNHSDYINFLNSKNVKNYIYILRNENLRSCLQSGFLYSRNNVKKLNLNYVDISNPEMQSNRKILNPKIDDIHNYVPLFFCDDPPMLQQVMKNGKKVNICIIHFRHEVLLNADYFSDNNLASSSAQLYNDTIDLDQLNWDLLNSSYRDTTINREEQKKCKSAEILIKDSINIKYIEYISFHSSNTEIRTIQNEYSGFKFLSNNQKYWY
jgi:hypothetical protein